jgi:4-hydroxybenzoate polyprenyltransferase
VSAVADVPDGAASSVATRAGVWRWIELIRVKQWIKNGFVLAGLFFSDQAGHARVVGRSLAAVLAFCFVSGAVYCLNDIFDRVADAAHPEKRSRPVASGAVSPREAIGVMVALLAGAAAIVAAVGYPWQVAAILATYFAMNVAYSARLKHVSLVDVVVIAAGFVLRLVAGTYAVNVPPTSWIVLCTGLLSLFLALGKRRGDVERDQATARDSLSGYTVAYIDQALGMIGAATIVVYALFTVSEYAMIRYDAPLLYLTTFPVALGFLRYLQIVVVDGQYGSPVDVALHDRPLQLVGLIWLAMFATFVYG